MAFAVGLWKEILKEVDWISENWKSKIGRGMGLRFWIDHWSDSSALYHSSPTIFELATNKQEILAKVWDQVNGQGSRNIKFVRAFSDWELDMVVNLLHALHALQNEKVNSLDRICWTGGKGNHFSVRDAYRVLEPNASFAFLVKGIWVACALTKTTFFTWEAAGGKVLTIFIYLFIYC